MCLSSCCIRAIRWKTILSGTVRYRCRGLNITCCNFVRQAWVAAVSRQWRTGACTVYLGTRLACYGLWGALVILAAYRDWRAPAAVCIIITFGTPFDWRCPSAACAGCTVQRPQRSGLNAICYAGAPAYRTPCDIATWAGRNLRAITCVWKAETSVWARQRPACPSGRLPNFSCLWITKFARKLGRMAAPGGIANIFFSWLVIIFVATIISRNKER